jgi:hypothetical protein
MRMRGSPSRLAFGSTPFSLCSRVGAAQDQVRYGVELPAVTQTGGWKTAEMVSRYTTKLDARRKWDGEAGHLAKSRLASLTAQQLNFISACPSRRTLTCRRDTACLRCGDLMSVA